VPPFTVIHRMSNLQGGGPFDNARDSRFAAPVLLCYAAGAPVPATPFIMPTPDLDAIAAYDFELPPDRVAALPADRRSDSRLMVLTAGQRDVVDTRFTHLGDYLGPNDLLVFNDVRVSPVRLHAQRVSGGQVEVFVVGLGEEGSWSRADAPWVCMTRSSKRLRAGEALLVHGLGLTLTVLEPDGGVDGRHRIAPPPDTNPWQVFEQAGALPLPPYVVRRRRELGLDEVQHSDRERYQTIFASRPGAVAAPTAALHFDETLMASLQAQGVRRAFVTLWVGAGTFQPVKTETLSAHLMHTEQFEVPEGTVAAIEATRARGGRVIAVGTTVVRTLESAVGDDGHVTASAGPTRLLIRPGFNFRVVDGLVTNFHLPKSTLMALVCAFGGYERVMDAYRHAVAHGYRFFSYGDSMFLNGRAS
jgi:S-adenosylmethionine:tRNA ribosyltransferase-isomerase